MLQVACHLHLPPQLLPYWCDPPKWMDSGQGTGSLPSIHCDALVLGNAAEPWERAGGAHRGNQRAGQQVRTRITAT